MKLSLPPSFRRPRMRVQETDSHNKEQERGERGAARADTAMERAAGLWERKLQADRGERNLGASISSSGSQINVRSQGHLAGDGCQNRLPLRLQQCRRARWHEREHTHREKSTVTIQSGSFTQTNADIRQAAKGIPCAHCRLLRQTCWKRLCARTCRGTHEKDAC